MKVNVCLLDIRSSDRVTDQTWRKFIRDHTDFHLPPQLMLRSLANERTSKLRWDPYLSWIPWNVELDAEWKIQQTMIDGKIRYIKSLIPYSDWTDSFLNWNYHSFTFRPCPEISWSKISLFMPTCSPSPPYKKGDFQTHHPLALPSMMGAHFWTVSYTGYCI